MKRLPPTGTTALLERLSAYIPDELINSLFQEKAGPGRPALLSPAQLFRVNLLALLTPAHSFNLLVELLPEHRPWRLFARLRNRGACPGVRMLHEFRARMEPSKLRQINQFLLKPLIEGTDRFAKTVSLIDSTDLPAATNAYKKMRPANTALNARGSEGEAARTGRVAIILDTRNTPCDCGFVNIAPAFYSRR